MDEVRTGYPYEFGAEDPFAPLAPVVPPCPVCSGNVGRDSLPVRALEWGLRAARQVDPVWRGFEKVDLARTGGLGRLGSDPVEEFVHAVLEEGARLTAAQDAGTMPRDEVYASMLGLEGALAHMDPVFEGRPSAPIDHGPTYDQPRRDDYLPLSDQTIGKLKLPTREEDDDEWAGKGVCCVLSFDYPASVKRNERGNDRRPGAALPLGVLPPALDDSVEGSTMVRVEMKWNAVFDDQSGSKTEGPVCLGPCCVFRHFILRTDVLLFPPSSGSVYWPSGGVSEDNCSWYFVGSDGWYVERVAKPGSEEEEEHRGQGAVGPFCFGHRSRPKKPHTAPRKDGYHGKNKCKYWGADYPAVPVPFGYGFQWSWLSLGVIYDKCNNYSIKAIMYAAWSEVGKVSGSGAVEYDSGTAEDVPDSLDSGFSEADPGVWPKSGG